MTFLILKLSSLIGQLSAQNLRPEEREAMLIEIKELIEDYFRKKH